MFRLDPISPILNQRLFEFRGKLLTYRVTADNGNVTRHC